MFVSGREAGNHAQGKPRPFPAFCCLFVEVDEDDEDVFNSLFCCGELSDSFNELELDVAFG